MSQQQAETYAILLEPRAKTDVSGIARALAPALDVVSMDLARDLRNRSGILAEHLSEAMAGRAAVALQQHGVPFFVVRQRELLAVPPAFEIREGKALEKGYQFASSKGKHLAPWEQIIFLGCSRVQFQEMKAHTELERDVVVGPRGHVSTHWRQKRRKRPVANWRELLDMVCYRPWMRLRFDSTTYRFAADGLPVHPSRHENFVARVVVLKTRCERATTGPGVESLLDGNPVTNLRSSSIEAYENHIRWRLQLIFRKQRPD